MGVNSLNKTVTRQRHGCDLNSGPTVPESSMLTTWIPSHSTVGHCKPFAKLNCNHFQDVTVMQLMLQNMILVLVLVRYCSQTVGIEVVFLL